MSVQALGWVLDHSPAKGTDRLVLLSIANHAGPSTEADGTGAHAWEAWPGVALMAREAGLDRTRTAQDALTRLVQAGHLERVTNGAPDERIRKDRRPNLYRILLDHGVPCGDTRCRWCGVTRDAARGDAGTSDGVTRERSTGCRHPSPEPIEEPSVKPSLEPIPPLAVVVDDDTTFDAFWSAWPKARRVGKGDAMKAWERAVKRAAPSVIVAGAVRYARETEGGDPQFLKHPHRWLNADRWLDEPGANREQRSRRPRDVDDSMRDRPTGWVAPEDL